MKLIIDTHNETEDKVNMLIDGLRGSGWDVQANNHTDDPTAPIDINEQPECQHTYVNGICTKCNWLQI